MWKCEEGGGKCCSEHNQGPASTASVFQGLDEMDLMRGLWGACLHGELPSVLALISKGKDPNQTDSYGFTPLHYAARKGHVEICEVLLKAGADVNAQTRSGLSTPLHRACHMGHMRVVLLLLQSDKCFPLIQDSDGMTCLHKAVREDHWKIAELLLKHSPQIAHILDKSGKTALSYVKDDDILSSLANFQTFS